MLVRGIDDGWTKGSVIAVDAGVQPAAITKILQDTQPEGLGTTHRQRVRRRSPREQCDFDACTWSQGRMDYGLCDYGRCWRTAGSYHQNALRN
ncbi:hypothetical protein F5Y08DRAFT_318495, partial [Xylaria arbuscula]